MYNVSIELVIHVTNTNHNPESVKFVLKYKIYYELVKLIVKSLKTLIRFIDEMKLNVHFILKWKTSMQFPVQFLL